MGSARPSASQARGNVLQRVDRFVAALAILLLVSLAVRLWMGTLSTSLSYDGAFYLDQGRHIAANLRIPFSSFPPGWPLLIATGLSVIGPADPFHPLQVAHVWNAVLTTLTGALTFLWARPRLGPAGALITATLILILPLSIEMGRGDYSEPSFTVALLAGLLLLQRERPLAAGLFWGFAYLVRPEGLLTLAAVGLHLAFRRRHQLGRYALGAALVVVPYVLFVFRSTGRLQISGKSMFLERVLDQGTGPLVSRYLDNSAQMAGFLPELLGLPLLALALVGLVVGRGLWAWCLLPLLSYALFDFAMAPRYVTPYVPFLLFSAGLATLWLAQRFSERRRVATAAIVAVAVVGFLVPYPAGWKSASQAKEAFPTLESAGLWLRDRVDRQTRIAAQKPYVSHFAWCRYALIPRDLSLQTLVPWLNSNGSDYLVLNTHLTRPLSPHLEGLLDGVPAELQPHLEPIQVFTNDQGTRGTAVFAVRTQGR